MLSRRLRACQGSPRNTTRRVGRKHTGIFARQAAQSSREARPENAKGDYFVDHTCIDCDTCRWMAPNTFVHVGQKSAVGEQPTSHQDRVVAMKALLSCPTYSIHTSHKTKEELREAQEGLPEPVEGVPNVFLNGWTSEKSFASASYLIQRAGGNIMVDSPRFNPVLARQIERLGGVKYIFLTHKDDVADHAQWARHFQATRVLHSKEVNSGTQEVEAKLVGEGPWRWSDIEAGRYDSMSIAGKDDGASTSTSGNGHESHHGADAVDAEEIQLIFTPGHTSAHTCLYYAPSQVLFSGDHLAAPSDRHTVGEVEIFDDFNWYSVPKQIQSVAKLLQYDFLHVLPGHGRRAHFADAMERLRAVSAVLRRHGAADVADRAMAAV